MKHISHLLPIEGLNDLNIEDKALTCKVLHAYSFDDRCDNKNLGLSDLCTFDQVGIDPPIWGEDVIIEEIIDDELPSHIYDNVVSNIR